MNASIQAKVFKVARNAAPINGAQVTPAVAAKPSKDAGKAAPVAAAPPVTQQTEELIIEFSIPLSALVLSKNCNLDFGSCFLDKTSGEKKPKLEVFSKAIIANRVKLYGRLFGDNDLSEYTAGCQLLQWETPLIEKLSSAWGLHLVEVQDGKKEKVPPTEQELRNRYIDNVYRMSLGDQSDLIDYSLIIMESNILGPETDSIWNSTVGSAKIYYEQKLAAAVPLSVDIRKYDGLWTLKWDPNNNYTSPYAFLHRTHLRAIHRQFLLGNDKRWIAKLTRTPLKDPSLNTEGEPLSLEASLSLTELCQVDVVTATFQVPLRANDPPKEDDVTDPELQEEPTAASSSANDSCPILQIKAKLTGPIKSSSSFPSTADRVADSLTQKGVTAPAASGNTRNVLSELHAEIAAVVKEVAQEYISLYPTAPQASSSAESAPNGAAASAVLGNNIPVTAMIGGETEMEQRKANFLHHLSSSGLYHALKEKLKPKIQRVVREKYGVRGRALGTAAAGGSLNSALTTSNEEASMDQLLGELYVYLVKESNTVLNQLYHSTMIARDEKELEQVSVPANDDETESSRQIFQRLLSLAADAELDGRPDDAEQFHLERVQLVAHAVDLGKDSECVFSAYAELGQFLLRRSAGKWKSSTVGENNEPEEEENEMLSISGESRFHVAKAREALELAVAAASGRDYEWKARMLLICLLIEGGTSAGIDRAEAHIQKAIQMEIKSARIRGYGTRGGSSEFADGLSVDNFEGYDSDEISPAQPLLYVALSLLSLQRGRALSARKALKLATRYLITVNYLFT